MTVLTRRGMLGGAAAIAVGSLSGTPPARAAAPLIGKQGPSFYRYKVGDFEVTALNEGVVRNATPANMAVNKTLPDVQKALGDAFLPTDHVINQFNTIVVNTGRNLVLIDSGFGDNGPPTGNNLLSNMSAAGIDPKNIDTILVSHFHGDHISGIRAKGGAANYPNAEIMVPSGEWQFWNDASNQAKVIDNFKPGFANVKRVFDPVAKDVKQFEQRRVDPRFAHHPVRLPRLAVVREVTALERLEVHPEVAVVVLDLEPRRGRARDDRPAPLGDEHRRAHRRAARVLEHDVDVAADRARGSSCRTATTRPGPARCRRRSRTCSSRRAGRSRRRTRARAAGRRASPTTRHRPGVPPPLFTYCTAYAPIPPVAPHTSTA